MRSGDIAIVILLVAALVVTAVGVAKSPDWTGERTYHYAAATLPLASQGPTAAGSAPARFEWSAPDNSTGAALAFVIDFTGQSVQGGQAVIKVSGTAPDGTPLPTQTRTMPVASGVTSAQLEFTYNATWRELPEAVRDTQPPAPLHWDHPLVVLVSVERPSDLPVATYAFTAAVTGSFILATVA